MLLITNRMKQTCNICSAWVHSEIMNTHEKPSNESHDTAQEGTLLTKWRLINYWPVGTALRVYVVHAFRERGVTFREYPSNGSR
jgi:hypothetical protein